MRIPLADMFRIGGGGGGDMYVERCVCNVSGLTRSVVLPTPLSNTSQP